MSKNLAKTDNFSPRPSAAELAIQLPYDRLKTPDTTYEKASLPAIRIARDSSTETDEEGNDVALVVSVCTALLYRYSGQSTIPLCVDVGGSRESPRFTNISIGVTGADCLADIEARISRQLSGSGNYSQPNAPVCIAFDSSDDKGEMSRSPGDQRQVPAELHLNFAVESDSWAVSLDYDASLFEKSTVSRLLEHLGSVLTIASRSGTIKVAEIDLYTAQEKSWFEEHCSGARKEFSNELVHVEFERCAANTPDKVAVTFRDTSTSYRDLNEQANRLGRYLSSRGALDGSKIVVCVEPSIDIVVTLLAIFKVGATYVPLNPSYPILRLQAIIEDVSPAVIVTQSHLIDLLESWGGEPICLDDDCETIATLPCENLEKPISLGHIAHIYYTSGTTGKPKGVRATHGNLAHFIRVSRHRYGISSDEVIPAVASFTFSISMFELMSPLSVGGTLLVLEREHVLDVERMALTLQQVSMFHIGPALLKNIVNYIKQESSDFAVYCGVRHASSGGDMIPVTLLRDMRQIFAAAEVFVIYGCSEISLMGCTWEFGAGDLPKTYVGKPFTNVFLRVLDDDGNRTPIGAVGDVCFGGPGVASGYVNRPDLTKKMFFAVDGMRFYRTGDRGRLSITGDLELLGRRDFQIQLRGMRVELGEIEHHLRKASAVRDGVVAARKQANGEDALVAYFVSQPGHPFDIEALRTYISARLPSYMVPTFFIELDALPLNLNMKVDRAALPEIEKVTSGASGAPATSTEKVLSEIWCELLHSESVPLDANFMSLGGDSLLAMQMILTVKRRLGIKLDGMDILRESLYVLAEIAESTLGIDDPQRLENGRLVEKRVFPVESFYFGKEKDLYGLFHPAQRESHLNPVLICPPIGYEYAKCHFLLRLLAEALASAGAPVLRFDLFGTGDSLGRDVDASMRRWRADIFAAREELLSRTGSNTVRVFALRMTTVLAFQSLRETLVDRWVLWDPVTSGDIHYRQLQRMNREKVKNLMVVRNLKSPRIMPEQEELVGTVYSHEAIADFKSQELLPHQIPDGADVAQVLSADFDGEPYTTSSWSDCLADVESHRVPDRSYWYRSTTITAAITYQSVLKILEYLLTEQRQ